MVPEADDKDCGGFFGEVQDPIFMALNSGVDPVDLHGAVKTRKEGNLSFRERGPRTTVAIAKNRCRGAMEVAPERK